MPGRLATFVVLIAIVAGCSAAPVAERGVPPPPSPSIAVARPPTTSPTPTPTASPTPIPLPSEARLTAPSGSVVWAVVGGTRLFRSTDRGDTWQERSLPPQPGNAIPAFVDDHQGWLVIPGSPATQCQMQSVAIWHTLDAGATWQRLSPTGIADGQCKSGPVFTDPNHGELSAYSPNDRPVVYGTADGGRSWAASRPLVDPPGFTSGGGGFELTVGAMRAFGATLLAAVAGNGSGQIGWFAYRSSDGGATWTYVGTAPDRTSPIVFVTATRWLQIDPSGGSKETTDAGASWHGFTSDYGQAAPIGPVITFGDAQVGYATVRGAIQRTTDGGAHWSAVRTPGTF